MNNRGKAIKRLLLDIRRKPVWLVLIGLLVFNGLFFLLKNLQVFTSWEQRQPDIAYNFIKRHIPKGSKVVGSPLYYYAVIEAGSDYQYFNYYNELEERERLHREVYQYDYLIVTDYYAQRDYKRVIPYYFSKAELELVAALKSPQSEWGEWLANFQIGGFSLISNVEKAGYSCKLYKRRKGYKETTLSK